MAIRIKSNDINRSSASSWQTHHEARVVAPLADKISPDLFLDVRGNLHDGDSVRLIGYERRDRERYDVVKQWVDLMMVEVTTQKAEFVVMGPIVDVETLKEGYAQAVDVPPPTLEPTPEPEAKPKKTDGKPIKKVA